MEGLLLWAWEVFDSLVQLGILIALLWIGSILKKTL